ncbi:MAG: translocation/assembly module TamB domain-containing protein [Bacteroidetes bacterium]|nr:translocation/assembly module TamB domain-containing protein [Bacteroidota bacterium]
MLFNTNNKIIKKKIRKILIYVLSVIIIIPVLLLAILSNSAVQTYCAHKYANYISDKLHTEISISKLKITPGLHILLEEVFVNDLYHNPLLRTEEIDCKISKFSFLKGRIEFSKILFNRNMLSIIKYRNDSVMNYQFLVNYYKSNDTTSSGKIWHISAKSFEINESKIKYQNQDFMNFISPGLDINNLMLTNVNLKIDSLSLKGDTVKVDLSKFCFNDKSGFSLHNFSTKLLYYNGYLGITNLNLETAKTNLSLDLELNYNNKEDLKDFANKVQLKTSIRPSKIDLKDVGYFSESLSGMNDVLRLSGKISGTVSNLKFRELAFEYGKSTAFKGNISLNGLPNINETFIHLAIDKFTTTKIDIESFALPGKNNHLQIPDDLLSFGNIIIKGDFTGFYNDFNAYADFKTQNGNFSTDITLKNNKKTKELEYKGHLAAKEFNMGVFLGIPAIIGKLNLNADISGSGITANTAKVKMTGDINQLEFKGNIYDSIAIKGDIANKQFNGFLGVQDDKIDLNFLGVIDFASNVPVFDFTANIRDANLYRLKLIDVDSTGVLSTNLNFNFTGKKVDDIVGTIKVENTTYTRKKESFLMKKLSLITYNDSLGQRKIDLLSDFIDANLYGKFRFADLPVVFNKFINNYLPSIDIVKVKDENTIVSSNEQNLDFNIRLKNTETITNLLLPSLRIAKNTNFAGSYNSQYSNFKLKGNSDSIAFNNQLFEKFYLEGTTDEKRLYLITGCKRLHFNETIGLDNFKISSMMQSDSIFYSFYWKDNLAKTKNAADIMGFASFNKAPLIEMQLVRSDIFVNDTVWKLKGKNTISFNKKDISLQNLILGTANESIKIDGNISEKSNEKLTINFNNFNLSQLGFLLADRNFEIGGILNGNIELVDLLKSPNFLTDIKILDVSFNKAKLGDLNILSTWDKEKDALFVKTNLIYTGNIGKDTTLFIKGYYYPNNKEQNFDLSARFNQLKLRSLMHYFKSFSSNFDGQAMGNITCKGTLENPEINGKILLIRGKMLLDYTKIEYTLSSSDSIEITSNYFKFSKFGINTPNGRALMDGKITHQGFRNIMIDLTFKYNNLMVLNTVAADNDLFYGKAFASGIIKISGPTKDIHLDIRAKTDKETSLIIPLTNKTETRENNFITFVEKQKEFRILNKSTNRFDGITMKCELEVTQDAEIGINLETPQTTGNIKAYGEGNIQLVISKEGDFNMYGNYILNDGIYYFSIQDILSKKFNIQKGGVITWKGDPYDATLQMKAIYNVRASLYPLLIGTATSDEISKKKVPVQSIISVDGKLNNPSVNFDFNFPTIDQDTKDRIFSILDRNNQADMLQQSFSLLVMNSFISQNRNTYRSSIGSGVGNSSFEMVSNQISNWLSQISKDFDIGVNYRPGDQISSQELQIALSTQILNDRVSIDVNGSFGGDVKTTDATKQTSNIVGDVNIEYKITEDGRFRLKVFNRANTNEFMNTIAPYTQGIGFFYRREFDNIKELFSNPKSK